MHLPISPNFNIFAQNFANMPQTLKNIENSGEIVLYQPDDSLSLEVKLENETVWLSQQQIATLFNTTKQNVSLHINNIFKEGELNKDSVVKESLTTAADGKKYRIAFYNLDVIISVGYRVKSLRGTQFRQWATAVLKDYLLKGYNINQRLVYMEERIDRRLNSIESTLAEHQQKIDFFVKTNLPPIEQVFFNGQFFEARVVLENNPIPRPLANYRRQSISLRTLNQGYGQKTYSHNANGHTARNDS